MGKGCSEDLVSYQDRQRERLKRTGHDLVGGRAGWELQSKRERKPGMILPEKGKKKFKKIVFCSIVVPCKLLL